METNMVEKYGEKTLDRFKENLQETMFFYHEMWVCSCHFSCKPIQWMIWYEMK